MKTYRIKLRPLGPWSTPWDADSLFGALAWQVLRLSGEDKLSQFLASFSNGSPPFVLSDAFPEGFLPCPLSAQLQALPDSNMRTKLPEWVSEEQFRALIERPAPLPPQYHWPAPLGSTPQLHASIHRLSGSTGGEAKLFQTEEWYFLPVDGKQPEHLIVYVRTDGLLELLVSLLEHLGQVGFGKKRSVGRGAFQIEGVPEPCEWMDQREGADGFVSLSHFIPANNDPTEGRWRLRVKYPKFSPGIPVATPFKGRMVMVRPGSAFRVGGAPREFYGMVLGMGPTFPGAVHSALAFAVPMRWPDTQRPEGGS